jgi:hypothetical protein
VVFRIASGVTLLDGGSIEDRCRFVSGRCMQTSTSTSDGFDGDRVVAGSAGGGVAYG